MRPVGIEFTLDESLHARGNRCSLSNVRLDALVVGKKPLSCRPHPIPEVDHVPQTMYGTR